MTARVDAVVTAGARLDAEAARRYGTEVKALVRIAGRTLLASVVEALRGVPSIGSIAVVGPAELRRSAGSANRPLEVDRWIDERPTGEENILAALEHAGAGRIVICASDLPFASSASIDVLLRAAPAAADCVYPIFSREEFNAAYPGARSSYAVLADGEWTGGSALVVSAQALLRNEPLLRRAFAARKSLIALASLLGPALALRYAARRLRIEHVKARVDALTGANMHALRGSDPALAMDCDTIEDFEYAIGRLERDR